MNIRILSFHEETWLNDVNVPATPIDMIATAIRHSILKLF
jgi:hypothetical protein